MKFLVDGRVLGHTAYSGVENYAEHLFRKIGTAANIAAPAFENRYMQQLWEHTLLPWKARKYDLLFCPANIAPIRIPRQTKLVLTLHDVAFVTQPHSVSSAFASYYRFLVPRNINRADRIITISEASRDEIIRYYPKAKEKISVIPLGVSSIYRPQASVEKKKQILYVGSVNERKNVAGVIEAFETLPEDFGCRLVLIGNYFGNFQLSERTLSTLRRAEKNPLITFRTGIDDEALMYEYNRSECLLFPSRYEGFGLPPLEAMACGTPVITSNVSSMPEVCGDAALYCDPYDINDIKNKIELLLGDETLREALRQKGLERAKLFTWEKAAAAHMQVFEEVLAQ